MITRVEYGVVLDDQGSTDTYATEAEARAHATAETPLVRIVTSLIEDKPVSIDDMPSGTTFRITGDEDGEIWTVQDNRVAVCSDHGVGRYLDVFDPSAIRDVTPPKENA